MGTQQAVVNVFSGKTALFGADTGKSLPFSFDEETQIALAEACDTLSDNIKDSLDLQDDETLTALITKLAAYCSKKGWNTQDKINNDLSHELPAIAEAIKDAPDALIGRAGIAGLLKKQFQKAEQANADARKEAINGNSKDPVLVMSVDGYDLFELMNPKQIKAEGRRMKHCMATSYNEEAMIERRLDSSSPGADRYLTYAVKVRSGEGRMYSLRDSRGRSKVSIEYSADKKAIVNMECKAQTPIEHDDPFFSPLCEMIVELGKVIDLSGGVACMPETGDNIVQIDDRFVPYTPDIDLDDVLKGRIVVNKDMPEEEVRRLALCPNIVLDLSDVNNEWINDRFPTAILANLETQSSDVFELEHVEVAAKIILPHASHVKLPSLKSVDEVKADQALNIYAPVLEKAKILWGDNLVCVAFPSLKHVFQEMVSKGAEEIILPVLERTHDMYFDGASSVSMPSLKFANDVYLGHTTKLEMPKNVCADIFAPYIADDEDYIRQNVLELRAGRL